MILKENLKSILESLHVNEIIFSLGQPGDFIHLKAHIFNTGSYATIESLHYDEEIDSDASETGNLFCDKDSFMQLLSECEIELPEDYTCEIPMHEGVKMKVMIHSNFQGKKAIMLKSPYETSDFAASVYPKTNNERNIVWVMDWIFSSLEKAKIIESTKTKPFRYGFGTYYETKLLITE